MLFQFKALYLLAIGACLTDVVLGFNGEATFSSPGLGSCGLQSTDIDFVVALSPQQMNGGASCFKLINVNFQGQSVQVAVVDTCPGCGPNDVNLSPGAFQQIASLNSGSIQVEWDFDN